MHILIRFWKLAALFSAIVITGAIAVASVVVTQSINCGIGSGSAGNSQGCCKFNPAPEDEMSEVPFTIWGTREVEQYDQCDPSLNFVDWWLDPAPYIDYITYSGQTTWCGTNYWRDEIFFYDASMPESECIGCGYIRRKVYRYTDC